MVTNNAWNSEDPAQVSKGGTGRASLTANNLIIGAGTSQVSFVAPSATSGVPVISQGAASDPAYGTAVVAGGGTGLTSTTEYAVLCGGTTTTGALQSIAGVGTSGQVLTSNGAGALPTFQSSGSGTLVQQAATQSNTAGSESNNIPNDDTIPQITEGTEFITLAYTPLDASNTLEIEFVGYFSRSTSATSNSVALFVDATANAIASVNNSIPTNPSNAVVSVVLRYQVSAASTSARTYRIRYGANTNTAYVNQSNDGSNHGDTLYSTLTVKEFS